MKKNYQLKQMGIGVENAEAAAKYCETYFGWGPIQRVSFDVPSLDTALERLSGIGIGPPSCQAKFETEATGGIHFAFVDLPFSKDFFEVIESS